MTPASQVSLAELRLAIGRRGQPLTQVQAAALSGVSRSHLAGTETGAVRPSQFALSKLALAYGVDLETIRAAHRETLRRLRSGEPQVKHS